MSLDLPDLREVVTRRGRIARVVVAGTAGSVPREVGASMLVWEDGQTGTIGGGALEWDAAAQARQVLAGAAAPRLARVPLGPGLGQCCGGAVTLLTEIITAGTLDEIAQAGPVWARRVGGAGPGQDAGPGEGTGLGPDGSAVAGQDGGAGSRPDAGQAPLAVEALRAQARRGTELPAPGLIGGWMVEPVETAQHALWLHGAGHVGRALVGVVAPLPGWRITWVDTARDRFPEDIPSGVDMLVAADPARAVAHAPANAHHLILTYSHALDLALCDAVLRRGFASAGLIGSVTKWARFRKRLAAGGHAPGQIARITCPIGDPALGKHPHAIALGTAIDLLHRTRTPTAKALEA